MSDPSVMRKGAGIRTQRQNTERLINNGRVKGVKVKQTQQMEQS